MACGVSRLDGLSGISIVAGGGRGDRGGDGGGEVGFRGKEWGGGPIKKREKSTKSSADNGCAFEQEHKYFAFPTVNHTPLV